MSKSDVGTNIQPEAGLYTSLDLVDNVILNTIIISSSNHMLVFSKKYQKLTYVANDIYIFAWEYVSMMQKSNRREGQN